MIGGFLSTIHPQVRLGIRLVVNIPYVQMPIQIVGTLIVNPSFCVPSRCSVIMKTKQPVPGFGGNDSLSRTTTVSGN